MARFVVMVLIIGLVVPMTGCKKLSIQTKGRGAQVSDSRVDNNYDDAKEMVRERRVQTTVKGTTQYIIDGLEEGVPMDIQYTVRAIGITDNKPTEVVLKARYPFHDPKREINVVVDHFQTPQQVADYLLGIKDNAIARVKTVLPPRYNSLVTRYPGRDVKMASSITAEGTDPYDGATLIRIPQFRMQVERRVAVKDELQPKEPDIMVDGTPLGRDQVEELKKFLQETAKKPDANPGMPLTLRGRGTDINVVPPATP